jgi:hypothetical protein
LVWYAPDAIYFGIKARELHGNVVRATHANRDNIDSEDQVQILLDTDNSRQIAFLFGVNPYGVQQDGRGAPSSRVAPVARPRPAAVFKPSIRLMEASI